MDSTKQTEDKYKGNADKIKKSLSKILSRFERLEGFLVDYMKIIHKFIDEIDTKSADKSRFLQYQKELKMLEIKEMSTSLKDSKDLFVQLKEQLKNVQGTKPIEGFTKTVITKGNGSASAILTPDKFFPDGKCEMKTPFDNIDLYISAMGFFVSYATKSTKKMTYGPASKVLDELFQKCIKDNKQQLFIDEIIIPMITYLKQKFCISEQQLIQIYTHTKEEEQQSAVQELINKINPCRSSRTDELQLNPEQLHAATLISGLLMICESQGKRNPTFGKLERKAIKSILNLAQKNYDKPFEKIFSNRLGRYIPSYDTESHYLNKLFESKGTGGVRQTNMILGFELTKDNKIFVNKTHLPDNILKVNTQRFFDKNLEITLRQIKEICKYFKISPTNRNAAVVKQKLKAASTKQMSELLEKDYFVKANDKLKEYMLLRLFSLQIDDRINSKGQIALSDLPNNKNRKFKFDGKNEETPREFFERLFEKNLKRLYKIQNRTFTSKLLKHELEEKYHIAQKP